MAQQYASWKTMRLTIKLTPSATSMTGNLDVGTTSGRFYLSNNNQVEWISFSGKTANWDGTFTYTGLTRGLSQTADPITGGTGQTWLANQECILVAMHDQLVDKSQDTAFASNVSVGGDLTFPGTTTGGLVLKTLTTTQRNALTPVTGYKIYNSTTGTVQTYYGGTWNDEWNSTTPNASTTVAGKVEIATQAEVNAGTDVGWTGATVVVIPSTLANATTVPNIHGATQKVTPVGADELIIADSVASYANKRLLASALMGNLWWTGSDGALSVSSGTTTLAFDTNGFVEKNYSSLTITGWTLTVSWPLSNGGIALIKVKWDCTITGWTINMDAMGWAGWAVATAWSQWMSSLASLLVTKSWGWARLLKWAWVWLWQFVTYCWAGGGWSEAASGWIGGRWGGWLYIEVGWTLTFSSPATITANGAAWSTNTSWGWGGGGWLVIINARVIASQTGTITCNGWAWWVSTSSTANAWWSWGGSYSAGWDSSFWSASAWSNNSLCNWWAAGTWFQPGGGGWAWFYKIN